MEKVASASMGFNTFSDELWLAVDGEVLPELLQISIEEDLLGLSKVVLTFSVFDTFQRLQNIFYNTKVHNMVLALVADTGKICYKVLKGAVTRKWHTAVAIDSLCLDLPLTLEVQEVGPWAEVQDPSILPSPETDPIILRIYNSIFPSTTVN